MAQVFTNESNTPEKAHVRYQDTFIHLMDWHLGNIFDGKTPDKAYTSIQAVRSLHAAIRKEMTDNPPGPIPDGATQWMSSYNVSPAWCGQMKRVGSGTGFLLRPALVSHLFVPGVASFFLPSALQASCNRPEHIDFITYLWTILLRPLPYPLHRARCAV